MKIEAIPDKATNEGEAKPPVRPPRRPLTAWIFVLPVILLLGLLFQARQNPNSPTPATSDLPPSPTAQPSAAPDATSAPVVGSSATPRGDTTTSSYTLYVPGPDAKLHERIVHQAGATNGSPTPAQYEAWYNQQANRALALLFKERNFFPTGTQTPQATLKNDIVNLNLNKSFGDSKLWKSEPITQLVVYSLVNTLLSPSLKRDGKPKGVLLLIDNHPVTTLGEFDASDPIEPNLELVAKS